jgi:transposase
VIAFGCQCPVSDLFGVAGRKLLAGLEIREPWRGHVNASLALIDDLERRIGEISRFASPVKLTGFTGLCPRVSQSGDVDRRGPLSKHGPRYFAGG